MPVHQAGDPIAVHEFSCHDPEQHHRAVRRGHVIEVCESRSPKHPEVVAYYYRARLDSGEVVQLSGDHYGGPFGWQPADWSETACPNWRPATIQREAS
ncbi:MAG TPA: hypothetical protein VG276_28950 [Actinomycetes bacterium]|jgi:hypothetical protein|nr:hypothetical protein [Actinomycetes bacterium]